VSKSPPKTVTYSGGSDGVVMYLSSGATEFLHGVPVEVSAEDAKSLAGNPDFQPAPTKATTPTTQPSEEVSP
tara:strand:+ start:119 stop:334 length:216 start_codon:yes stop_codon:yes gene_type:complete